MCHSDVTTQSVVDKDFPVSSERGLTLGHYFIFQGNVFALKYFFILQLFFKDFMMTNSRV